MHRRWLQLDDPLYNASVASVRLDDGEKQGRSRLEDSPCPAPFEDAEYKLVVKTPNDQYSDLPKEEPRTCPVQPND